MGQFWNTAIIAYYFINCSFYMEIKTTIDDKKYQK